MTPQIKQGDLWKAKVDLILVTTNGIITDNKLVMGAGAAGQAKDRFPLVPAHAANHITESYLGVRVEKKFYYLYGLLLLPRDAEIFGKPLPYQLGLFQTKGLISRDSPLAMIGYSTMLLVQYLSQNPKVTVALNYPGIGHGKLDIAIVQPILDILPETVTLYTYPE